jgi:hypothetical protein
MSKCVERWMSMVARKEAFCLRWFFTAEDIVPFLGVPGAYLWEQYVASTDIDAVARELEYRVEESSAAKPNRNEEIAALNQISGMLMPFMQSYLPSIGNMEPMNALIRKFAKFPGLDISDVQMPNPPMPPMLPQPQEAAA